MDMLHIPQTLVDGDAYSSCRLRLLIYPETVTMLEIPAGVYADLSELVAALDAAFSSLIPAGQATLDANGRVRFSASVSFALGAGDNPEDAARRAPLPNLLGFRFPDCGVMSLSHTATQRPDGLWCWPVLDRTLAPSSEAVIHAANGAHGGGATVCMGVTRTQTLAMRFLPQTEILAWRRWFERAFHAPFWTLAPQGAPPVRLRPVLDDSRLEQAMGRLICSSPAYWEVLLTLLHEVSP